MPSLTEHAAGRLLADPDWYRALPVDRDVHELDSGLFAVTGYQAAQAALTHPELRADHPLKASSKAFGPNVLDSDGPRHRGFRALLAPILAAGKVEGYRRALLPTLAAALVEDLLQAVETDDFYTGFAHRVPYGVVARLLGVDPVLEPRFHTLTRPLASLLDLPTEISDQTTVSVPAMLELIEAQQTGWQPAADSLLATIQQTRDRKAISLSDAEVRSTALLFFLAGTETSSAFITSLLYCLARYVDDLAELADPQVRDGLIEEVLRLYPPVRTIIRFSAGDVSLCAVPVPRHSAVLVSIAAANRDPRMSLHPNQFQVERLDRISMPFSAGPHSCPGALLARTEFVVILEELVRRCAGVQLTRDGRRTGSQSFNRPQDFSLRFVAHHGGGKA